VRTLQLERPSLRISAGVVSADFRGLLERAVARAADSWSASDVDSNGDEYRQLSLVATAIAQVLEGQAPDFSRWSDIASVSEPMARLRRALLDEVSASPDRTRSEDVIIAFKAMEKVHQHSQVDVGRRFTERLQSDGALDLVVGLAHDMRSPLSSVLFLVDALRNAQRGTVAPMQERQLGLLYSASLGLSQLVSDVLELARGCDRVLDQHPIPFSVSELVGGVLDVVQPIAEEKQLQLCARLPEVDARIGYPSALSRVLLNLTTNALKFTNEGAVEVTCHQKSRSLVEFSVRDTGPGIPQEALSTLYDTFRQRHRSKHGYVLSSSGLGLSICQKLVTAMGGELQVETVVGKETRFTFVLDLPPAAKI
jgi:signal transduction histidine kinase